MKKKEREKKGKKWDERKKRKKGKKRTTGGKKESQGGRKEGRKGKKEKKKKRKYFPPIFTNVHCTFIHRLTLACENCQKNKTNKKKTRPFVASCGFPVSMFMLTEGLRTAFSSFQGYFTFFVCLHKNK